MEDKKNKILKLVKEGYYVDELTEKLDISNHKYYKLRNQDEEFDNAITQAIENRDVDKTKRGNSDSESMFHGGMPDQKEIKRRASIIRLFRKYSIKEHTPDYDQYLL